MTVRSSPDTAKGDKVKVVVRVRPRNGREDGTNSVVDLVDHWTIRLTHPGDKCPKLFAFDFCFSAAENEIDRSVVAQLPDQQQRIFDMVGTEVVENAFLGLNSCVFAYGQTGSGKSYTMMGTTEEPGIVPRLCTELFERLARELNDDGTKKFKLEVSFFEVYNERIRDLLGHSAAKSCGELASKRFPSLRVREHSLLGPMVEGLSVYKVNNYDQIERLIDAGNGARTTAATLMNETSSRSHSVFSLKLTQTIADAEDRTFTGEKVSKISLVDLAGSERVQKTGAVGKRLEEGGNINRSLSALGKVIAALSEKRGGHFVPYRDSVLTWLLKENLGGNSRTTMVATVSPSSDNYEETLSTLRFADRAKRIQTHAVINEDPNAKVIRELREEVERLRQLSQSHAEQNEQYLHAMEQINQRHEEDKSRALEAQYEQFTQYIAQLSSIQQQHQQSVQSASTPMTPFGTGIVPSMSMANGIFSLDQRDKGKFLEWAHRRQELFAVHLAFLRKSIQHAAALAAQANAVVASRGAKGSPPRVHYFVSLHIPAGNLRPCKVIGRRTEAEEDGMEEEEGGGECVCEPIIVAKWRGKRWAQQHWTLEQIECKLAELRTGNNEPNDSVESKFNLPLFGNLLARREKHTLIGVANVYLGHLLLSKVPNVNSQVLVINQQGEICGKMVVRVQRVEVRSDDHDDEEEGDREGDECQSDGEGHPENYLGHTMLCRVEIQSLISLPSDHCRLVFCQYSFHECPQVVVPSEEWPAQQQEAQSTAVRFTSANEFEVFCTRPFLDYLEEDALSVEVWGHRTVPDGEDEEEEEEKEEEEEEGEEEGEVQQTTRRPTAAAIHQQQHCENIQRNLCELVDQKKKSLRERWNEVTRRIELWVELLELNSAGIYAPVSVKKGAANDGTLAHCGTGGVYKLRHGQQRRIRLHLKSTRQSADFAQRTLPLRFSAINSVSIGSPFVVDESEAFIGTLDSYQEVDLARIRRQWNELLQRRANYLQGQIQSLSSEGASKNEFESECEHSLLQNWLELVEERNAIFLPSPGIPGAPTEWDASTSDENDLVGFERHCPLIFLQTEQSDENCNKNVPAGLANVLPMERPEMCQLEMPLLESRITETYVECSCPWDSSLHDCPALNRNSRTNECIFLILKIRFSISHPFPAEIVLRKRISLSVWEANSNSNGSATIWPWAKKSPEILTGTGLFVDVVACIPKSSVGFEQREVLAKLAVQHATSTDQSDEGTDGDLSLVSFGSSSLPGALADYSPRDSANNNYLSEYVSKTINAVEWLIKLDRLRQEEAIRRAMAKLSVERVGSTAADHCGGARNGRMTRTISLPTSMGSNGNFLSNFNLMSSKPIDEHADVGEQRMPFSPWLSALGQLSPSAPASVGSAPMMKSSQSHTDGFGHLLAQSRSPCPSASTSASSSGYASMANSIVNPCANRLAGIDEEDTVIGGGSSGRKPSTTIGENGNGKDDAEATQEDWQAFAGEERQPGQQQKEGAPSSSDDDGTFPATPTGERTVPKGGSGGGSGGSKSSGTNCCSSNNPLMCDDAFQQQRHRQFCSLKNGRALLPVDDALSSAPAPSPASASSASTCCCVENRLFMSCPPQQQLNLPTPSASPSSGSSSSNSSSSSLISPRPNRSPLLFFHNTATTIRAQNGGNCDDDRRGNTDQQQGTENKRKEKPPMIRRVEDDANGCSGRANCQRFAENAVSRMGFLN